MIIVAHIALFAVLYALGLPWLSAATEGAVSFNGGVFATIILALASEAVVLVMAVGANLLASALKINPLLQRKKAESIAMVLIVVGLSIFLYTLSAVMPALLSLTWLWALGLSVFTAVILQVMVTVKRRLIARSSS